MLLASKKVELIEEAELPKDAVKSPRFRVSSFAYQFKCNSKVLAADKYGIYNPETAEDIKFLEYQVTKQLITFS